MKCHKSGSLCQVTCHLSFVSEYHITKIRILGFLSYLTKGTNRLVTLQLHHPVAMQSAIIWPTKFLPGTTDNYVSNEVIVRDITAAQIWTYLADITQWESYYNNCSHITLPVGGNNLKKGDSF